MGTLHPEVHVQLTGRDGNAMMIIGACRKASRQAGLSAANINAFVNEAMDGDYDHLLATCMKWFTIE